MGPYESVTQTEVYIYIYEHVYCMLLCAYMCRIAHIYVYMYTCLCIPYYACIYFCTMNMCVHVIICVYL